MQDSAQHRGHFALYNCLVLGHTKFPGVQRICCSPFPAKKLCRQIQSGHHGMPEYCSCFQPLLRRTLDPSPSTVHLCRQWNLLWKHMTILKMVGLCIYALHILYVLYVLNALLYIIHIIRVMRIIQIKFTISFLQDG